jgi:hypothetical protein
MPRKGTHNCFFVAVYGLFIGTGFLFSPDISIENLSCTDNKHRKNYIFSRVKMVAANLHYLYSS